MVEDDRNFGTVMKAYMEINGFFVDWVQDGKLALKAFTEGTYDICILDVMLPNVDGFTIAGQIKEVNPNVPIVFLTAKVLKDDVLRGFDVGADDYVTKPFDSEILVRKIHAILSRNLKVSEQEAKETEFKIGTALFKFDFRTLQVGDEETKLSPKRNNFV